MGEKITTFFKTYLSRYVLIDNNWSKGSDRSALLIVVRFCAWREHAQNGNEFWDGFPEVFWPLLQDIPIGANEIQKHQNPQNENRRKMSGRWCITTHISNANLKSRLYLAFRLTVACRRNFQSSPFPPSVNVLQRRTYSRLR